VKPPLIIPFYRAADETTNLEKGQNNELSSQVFQKKLASRQLQQTCLPYSRVKKSKNDSSLYSFSADILSAYISK